MNNPCPLCEQGVPVKHTVVSNRTNADGTKTQVVRHLTEYQIARLVSTLLSSDGEGTTNG